MALSKKNLTVFIVLGVIVVIAILKTVLFKDPANFDPVEARTRGPQQAKVNIVEFIDFECPGCAYGAEKIKEYLAQHPNDIHLEVKYFPLMNVHHHALKAASYVECAARQGKFWPFFDPLMTQQRQWSPLVNAEGVLDQIAQGAGVDVRQLKSCLSSDNVSVKIMSEKAIGLSLGVQSTPTYFINKKMVVGAKSLIEELDTYFPKSK
jgi:protein-disulfide isomerase